MGSQNGKTDCSHQGKWGSLGVVILNYQGRVLVVHSLFCKECGASKMEAKDIPSLKQTKVAVPKIVIGQKPPGRMPPGGQRFE